jgi:hypothetical protein
LRHRSNATFFAPLSESRPLKERLQIVDDMYQRYEDEVRARAASPCRRTE